MKIDLAALIEKEIKTHKISLEKNINAIRVFTPAYVAAALDRKMLADGSIVQQSEERRIHVKLFWRTMEISFLVTVFCLILGYPDCILDGVFAYADVKLAFDSCSLALLDFTSCAHYCVDCYAAGAGSDE